MSENRWNQPGVPHKGWQCVDVVDLRAEGETADMSISTEIFPGVSVEKFPVEDAGQRG